MAYTSVKISADANTYKAEMKSAAEKMKELSSEYSVAATKAKLFGSETDSLKAKAESLTKKISVQNDIVKMSRERQEELTKKLAEQKARQDELKVKIEAAKKAYEDEKKATGATSDASKALKEELDKLKDTYEKNESSISKTETALSKQTVKANEAEVELMEMEAALKDVNEQLADTNEQIESSKLDDFAESCQSVGEKMENFGNKMMGVTKVIGGFAKESVKSFEELKEGYDIIVTKTGATGEALDGLKDSANKVFGSMPEDMSIVGEAIGEVNTRFHSTGEELEDLSMQFVQFASINGTQVTASVDQVDKIMQAWNIDASQTGNLLGLLTAKAQETGISVDSLEKYVLDNNSAFKEMGLTLPQAINLMAQFDANGVDTTTALAGLKKALQNATSEGKSMNVALKDTIGRIKNAKGDVEALQIATELFGKKGAAEMAAAIRENRIDLTELSTSIEEYGTIVEDTYNGTKSPLDDAKTAMNNVKVALGELADTALTGAAPIIKDLTGKIQNLTSWFTSLDKGQQQTIIKVGLMVAAVGPLAVGFGKAAKGISEAIKVGKTFGSFVAGIVGKITAKAAATAADAAATTANTAAEAAGTAATTAHTTATATATAVTGGMTVAQTALNIALNLCPIILIITLIAGLIAAGIALYKNWDVVKEKLTEFWEHIKEKFDAIKEKIIGVFKDAKDAVVNKVTEMKNAIVNSAIGKAASETFSTVKNAAEKIMGAAVETVKQNLSNMKKAYEENGGGIKGIVAAWWEGIKGYYESGFIFIDKLTGGKLTDIKKKFEEKIKDIKKNVQDAVDKIKEWMSFDNLKETIEEVWEGIKEKMTEPIEKAKEKIEEIIQKIKDIFNFKWELPKLKLPHFKVSGKFSLSPPTVPKFSIQWYKTGAIMNSPMIFGMNNNTLLAGGEPETGGEAILPLAPFYTKLSDMLDKKLATVQQIQNVYLESHTYIDGEEISNRTVSKVDAKMVQNRRKGR